MEKLLESVLVPIRALLLDAILRGQREAQETLAREIEAGRVLLTGRVSVPALKAAVERLNKENAELRAKLKGNGSSHDPTPEITEAVEVGIGHQHLGQNSSERG